MKKNRFYISILFLLFLHTAKNSQAQFVSVKDSAFARLLCDSFPSVMSGDCKQLDTVKAKKVTGNINGDGRRITTIDELVYFNQTSAISFANNTIKKLPDLSRLLKLTTINFSGNTFSGSLDFSKYLILKNILLNNNDSLTEITGLNQLSELKSIQISHCNLQSSPEIDKIKELNQVTLDNNQLTFADILPLTNNEDFKEGYTIFPQKSIQIIDSIINKNDGENVTIQFNDDKAISGLTYTWYFNSVKVKSGSDNFIIKTNLTSVDNGNYFVSIKSNNPLFLKDSIVSSNVILTVSPKPVIPQPIDTTAVEPKPIPQPEKPKPEVPKPCPQSIEFDIQTEQYCDSILLTITVNNLDTMLYSFTIENTFNHKKSIFKSARKFAIKQGTYSIVAKNDGNCLVRSQSNLSFDYDNNCTKYFTPNGDGVDDNWFIQDTGHVKIINSQYQVIKELDCPSEWDGTTQNNTLAPDGKYIILKPDGSKSAVTLFR